MSTELDIIGTEPTTAAGSRDTNAANPRVQPRYPGAQPFSDDPVSRSVFFGRRTESRVLADQIVANRLVVVYAKSGIGKTSLLQAGVAELLRIDGFVPLFVRVNDLNLGPLGSLFVTLDASSARQDLEYHPGDRRALWHFFKTVEFWKGDRLLTPVLILDQFEELFTLHAPASRAPFLRDLGALVRGARPDAGVPPSRREEPALGDAPPELRVVISLREEYLGALEESSADIPQILNHRFRLTALDQAAARQAMEDPASVSDARLATQPFKFAPGAVDSIIAYLSRRSTSSIVRQVNGVEPFHLQLICESVERGVAERQREGQLNVQVSLEDLRGEKGLDAILTRFYTDVLGGIAERRIRNNVRRLCEQYLISPQGRRLSLEQDEIRRLVHVQPTTLAYLVQRKLLRSDQRADSWYYELSHDSLIQPILVTRTKAALTLAVVGVAAGVFGGSVGITMLVGAALTPLIMVFEEKFSPWAALGVVLMYVLFGFLLWTAGKLVYRRSIDTFRRYRSRRAPAP